MCPSLHEILEILSSSFWLHKAFLSDQSKEIEENNKMGNTSDIFKKIRDTKRSFHVKMGKIKDYTKKIIMTQIIMMV